MSRPILRDIEKQELPFAPPATVMVNLRIWPLFLTRELHFETNLPAPKKEILRVMHDPQNALRNNPLIFYVEQDRDKNGELVAANLKYEATTHGFHMDPDAEDAAWFTIRETVRATGGISGTKDFETDMRVLCWRTEHGGGVFIDGKAWTTVHTRVTIEEDGEGAAIHKKHMVFKGLFFLIPFMLSTAQKNHAAIMNSMTRKALRQDWQ